MHGSYAQSTGTKAVWTLFHGMVLVIVGWFLFGNGPEKLSAWSGWEFHSGDLTRNAMLFVCSLVIFLRMNITGFIFLKRAFPWSEAFIVGIWLWIIHLTYNILGGTQTAAVGFPEWLGLALFFLGSYLNTGSEWQRHQFKKRAGNKGKLFTRGLFRYSMHINYFGDVIWAAGLAFITRSLWAWTIPAMMFLMFAFYLIPTLDRYLSHRYGEQFDHYSRKTKKFIPFVY
ncbi:DUF1295 domain-containing protein [Salinithrix halophila]|uniref:DUF1295 domain-containing protein n=1 Tax=Salinithrix halophila TaxID=1485204 RepID=A0ABV8JKW7_9BACL